MVIGDYNAVLDKDEKWGGKVFKISKAKERINLIDECKMMDLGSSGPTFTWNNYQEG